MVCNLQGWKGLRVDGLTRPPGAAPANEKPHQGGGAARTVDCRGWVSGQVSGFSIITSAGLTATSSSVSASRTTCSSQTFTTTHSLSSFVGVQYHPAT